MTDDRRDEPRRPRGRPRVPPHSSVHAWITTDVHDALIKRAKRRDQSLSKTIRDLLTSKLPPE